MGNSSQSRVFLYASDRNACPSRTTFTLAEVNGHGAYLVLGIPVIVAGMPLLLRSRTGRVLSAALLLCGVVIGFTKHRAALHALRGNDGLVRS
jgi:hypothetical protein